MVDEVLWVLLAYVWLLLCWVTSMLSMFQF